MEGHVGSRTQRDAPAAEGGFLSSFQNVDGA